MGVNDDEREALYEAVSEAVWNEKVAEGHPAKNTIRAELTSAVTDSVERAGFRRQTRPDADDESCNHGECAWQDGCTLKRCPAITTVSGDPWHGCSLPSGHSGDHDFSVRLYGAYPEFGITPPTDDEREALARIIHADDVNHDRAHDDFWLMNEDSTGWYFDNADAILASDVWRNRRKGPITDEWEYGVEVTGWTGEPVVVGMTWTAPLANAKSFFPAFIRHVRRRKAVEAGPWEPVEAAERARRDS